MLMLKKNIEVRRELVDKIVELTGIRSFYTRAPLYAYEIGPYTVDREGNLLVREEDADWEILNELLEEELVLPAETLEETESEKTDMQETAAEGTEETDAVPPTANRVMVIRRNLPDGQIEERTESSQPVQNTQARSILDFSPTERVSALESLFAGSSGNLVESDTSEEPDPLEADGTEEEESVEENTTVELSDETAREECASIEEAEETPMEILEEPIAKSEVSTTEDETLEFRIVFPISNHNGLTLKNLLHMIFTRGELLNKATGAHFDVNEELIRRMDIADPKNTADFLKVIEECREEVVELYTGLDFSEEQVAFTGFPEGMAADQLDTCMKLAALINKTVLESRSVQAKRVPIENERYTFRVWLLHLGMKGKEYGMARKMLMKNLSGHTAFRTEADAEKARLRAERIKAELAAAKAEQEESIQPDTPEELLEQTVEMASEETAVE